MARSNSPGDQAGAQAPQWRYPTDQDPQTRPPAPQQQPAWPFQAGGQQAPLQQQQPAQPHATQPLSQMFGAQQQRPPAHAAYQAPPADPYAHHAPPSQHPHYAPPQPAAAAPHRAAAQQPTFTHPPAFDRFAPPQQIPAAAAQADLAHMQHGHFAPEPQRSTPFGDPRQAQAPYPAAAPHAGDFHRDLRGPQYDQSFEQWPQAPGPQGQHQGQQAAHPQHPQGLDQWTGRDPFEGQHIDPAMQGQAQGYVQQHAGHGQQLQPADGGYEHDEEVEETGGRRRGLMVVAALVGAIALGGGLAFAYKTFLATPPKTAGGPPTVKKEATPVKTKPADPGGKQFANQDSKVLGRLGEETDSAGVRKVPTIPVGRDGTIGAPQQAAAAPIQPQQGTTAVPGLFLDPGPVRPAPAQPAAVQPPAPVQSAAAPRQPAVQIAPPPAAVPAAPVAAAPVAAAPKKPSVVAAAPQPDAAAPTAVPAAPAKAPAKKPKPRDDLAVAGGAAAAPTTTGAVAAAPAPAALGAKGGNGFVAVLASRPSQMDALKTIADLQQKYPGQLSNKIVTVQETDLSAQGKGVVHRVIVGPPGSRELANDVCGQIRTAGHKDCWLTAY